MLTIEVMLVFEDCLGRRIPIVITFTGRDYCDAYEQALEFTLDKEECNEWALIGGMKVRVLDTRS